MKLNIYLSFNNNYEQKNYESYFQYISKYYNKNIDQPCHLLIDNIRLLQNIPFLVSASSIFGNMHKPFDMVSFFYFIVLHIFLLLCPGKCYMGSFYAIHFTFETDGDLFSFSKNKMHVYCLFCGKRVYRTISSSLDHRL